MPAHDESLTPQALQNIDILFYLISLIFCLILQLSFAAMRSVVPPFLNKRRCGDVMMIDDIKEWCRKDLCSLTIFARGGKLCKQTMKLALDTYRAFSPWIMMMMMIYLFIH